MALVFLNTSAQKVVELRAKPPFKITCLLRDNWTWICGLRDPGAVLLSSGDEGASAPLVKC